MVDTTVSRETMKKLEIREQELGEKGQDVIFITESKREDCPQLRTVRIHDNEEYPVFKR